MSCLEKICCQIRIIHAEDDSTKRHHRTTQMPRRRMRHQVNHTLVTKIGAACLRIFLNLISKSAARCKWSSDPFLLHCTLWLRCLLQRSPHPHGFAALTSTVDPFQTVLWSHLPRPKVNLLNQTRCAHTHLYIYVYVYIYIFFLQIVFAFTMVKGIAKNSRFALLQKGKQHPHTKTKGKSHQSTEQPKLKHEELRNYITTS